MNILSMENDSIIAEIAAFTEGQVFGGVRFNSKNSDYFISRISKAFVASISDFEMQVGLADVIHFVEEYFFTYLPHIPRDLINQPGSTSAAGLLPLYLAARAINPDLIIESGVFIGSSLHMFATTFAHTPIYAFDIDMSRLRYRQTNVFLNEIDWIKLAELPANRNAVCFFDDHINCAKRILECRERGIRYAVFDDAPDVGGLQNYRYPALPSVPMILDESMPAGCSLEWHHQPTGKKLRYTHDSDLCSRARKAIKVAVSLDCFKAITGSGVGDKWLIELSH